ncbi:MAG: hypothetical protein HUJ25_00870 [Crocinitomicaceae bacterium]|nr:hypothetical protein [Crocinitomicaceae bacterium]
MKNLLLLCCILLIVSCKKDTIQYSFEGTVTDNTSGSGLSGATVKVYQKPFNNSVSSNTFELVGTDNTDANGHYTVIFDREKVTEFKILITKEGYFNYEMIVGSADVSSENTNVFNANMDGKSWAQFTIKNVVPADPGDDLTLIFYEYRKGCNGCIASDYNYFSGVVDTTITYANTAAQYLKFTYIDVSGGQSTTDSIYMTPNDTIFYSITY